MNARPKQHLVLLNTTWPFCKEKPFEYSRYSRHVLVGTRANTDVIEKFFVPYKTSMSITRRTHALNDSNMAYMSSNFFGRASTLDFKSRRLQEFPSSARTRLTQRNMPMI